MRRAWWVILVIVLAAGGTAAAILLPQWELSGGRAAFEEDAGAAPWSPKEITPEELPTRVRFRALLPARMPDGFALETVQVVWVVEDPMDLRLPARQAIRLVYGQSVSDATLSLLEAAHVRNVDAHDNLWQVASQGYFGADLGLGSLISAGMKDGVDYLVVSDGAPGEAVDQLAASLAPAARP